MLEFKSCYDSFNCLSKNNIPAYKLKYTNFVWFVAIIIFIVSYSDSDSDIILPEPPNSDGFMKGYIQAIFFRDWSVNSAGWFYSMSNTSRTMSCISHRYGY